MLCCDIADELLDEDCFSYSGSSEESDFTTLCIWGKKVYDLDSCLEDFLCRVLLLKCWWLSVDFPLFFCIRLCSAVDCLTEHVEQSAESLLSDRCLYAGACGCYFHISVKSLAGSKHDTAYCIISNMLCDFHHTFFVTI